VIALIGLGPVQQLSGQQTAVVIDLTQQTAYLLENGRVALVSPVATGKEGWGKPTGKFQVINKDLNNTSADFGLFIDVYGRIVDPNATPSTLVPPGSLCLTTCSSDFPSACMVDICPAILPRMVVCECLAT
jgi:hypothetical protein